jgi:hypothetical protein
MTMFGGHLLKLQLFCHYSRVSLMAIVRDHGRSGNHPPSAHRRRQYRYFYPAGSGGVQTWANRHKVSGSDILLPILHKSRLDPDPVGTPLPYTSIDTLALLWGGIRRPMASEGAMLKSMSIDMMVRSRWFFGELARLRSYVSYSPVDTTYVQ